LIAYATKGKHVFNFPQGHHALNWWEITMPRHTTQHPTEKPMEVISKPISFSTKPGGIVFDGFSGSGTTLIACEQLSRQCRAIELDAGYVAVTLQRFYDATGIEPALIS
jgi:DNA modification methylase